MRRRWIAHRPKVLAMPGLTPYARQYSSHPASISPSSSTAPARILPQGCAGTGRTGTGCATPGRPGARVLTEHAPQHEPGLAEGLGAEEHPGHVDQRVGEEPERHEHERPGAIVGEARSQRPLDREIHPVQPAPGDEGPVGPVPEAPEQHGRHERRVGAARAVAIAPERNVEIVAQPRGQRDVPAAPEIREADRRIREAEVVRHGEPETQRRTYRGRRVAGEVAEDLAAEGERAGTGIERAV